MAAKLSDIPSKKADESVKTKISCCISFEKEKQTTPVAAIINKG